METHYQGVPAELRDEPDLLRLFLPVLRADLAIYETYQYRARPPLDCPIWVFGGRADARTSVDQLQQWDTHTTGAVALEMVEGGHFFPRDTPDALLPQLGRKLVQLVDKP
jgi:medium-chain acyl-[acyl-carrier-protein] hydrolase